MTRTAQRTAAPPRNPLESAFAARFGHRVGPDVPAWDRITNKLYTPWALGPHAIAEAQRYADACGITLDECWERQARAFETLKDGPAEELYRRATTNGR